MSDEDLWEAARARTREDVRQIFARTPEAPQRTCPHCGVHFLGGAAVFAPKPKMSLRNKCIVVLVTLVLLYMGLSDDIARWWW